MLAFRFPGQLYELRLRLGQGSKLLAGIRLLPRRARRASQLCNLWRVASTDVSCVEEPGLRRLRAFGLCPWAAAAVGRVGRAVRDPSRWTADCGSRAADCTYGCVCFEGAPFLAVLKDNQKQHHLGASSKQRQPNTFHRRDELAGLFNPWI